MVTIGSPTRERAILESTYEDVFSVFEYTDASIGSLTKLVKVERISAQICAFSSVNAVGSDKESHIDRDYSAVLFCAPELSVRSGASVEVLRFGQIQMEPFEVVGDPVLYPTHQEIRLRKKGLS